jgi:hypothetical protein
MAEYTAGRDGVHAGSRDLFRDLCPYCHDRSPVFGFPSLSVKDGVTPFARIALQGPHSGSPDHRADRKADLNMYRTFLLMALACLGMATLAQSYSQRNAVQMAATVQSAPPRITLSWEPFPGATGYTIYRKAKGAASWDNSIGTTGGSTLQFVDNAVTVGTYYEYKVVRAAGTTGTGYVASGIDLASVDNRGKMVVLVSADIANGIADELAQLEEDLRDDGWVMIRHDVPSGMATTAVRALVQADYNADPTNVKAVYIIGHVPVPYSGNLNPDGHGDHKGAWPCDGYYGEMDGIWTDNTVNNTNAQLSRNYNVPGDGKFDQSDYPSAIELQVGRIDFSNMGLPYFSFPFTETQLTSQYLNKAHAYKTRQFIPQNRGIVFDNFQDANDPLAGSGYRCIPALVGAANTTNCDPAGTPFHTLIDGQSYLWTYSSGGGTWVSAYNVGTTDDYADIDFGGVFNMSFGSYFGDWDVTNSFLRATIASGNALSSVWSGIPNWWFQNMGMGDNIGYCAWLTMNNTGLYSPQNGGQSSLSNRVHLALLGDPSLRMTVVARPSGFQVTNNAGTANFTWSAPSDAVDGYNVYEVNQTTGQLVKLNSSPVTQPSFSSLAIPFVGGKHYMVRSVKMQTTNTGRFQDLSLGVEAVAAGSSPLDCNGTPGGSVLPGTSCDDGNASTINDVLDANCQCAGTLAVLDCQGVPNGAALPGTACNDNDQQTIHDTWTSDCTCIGEQVSSGAEVTLERLDCNGVSGGSAIIDDCGVCSGGETGITPNADDDDDGLIACQDNCLTEFNPGQADFDGDGIGDACDNCVWVDNEDQSDSNGNGVGDACELATGVMEAEVEGQGMAIYPNPARDHVLVRCNAGLPSTLLMADPSGRTVAERAFEQRMDVSGLATGTYVVFAIDRSGKVLARVRLVKL